MAQQTYQIGMIGLGVMGRNFALNLADHGFSVVGYDLDEEQVAPLKADAGDRHCRCPHSGEQFITDLAQPRAIMMLVPAGKPVDAVIQMLLPHLSPGDLLIDGGNSYYQDTALRAKTLAATIDYLGLGISGGEVGARQGPSLMPGGPRAAYQRVQPL
ncbi:MAG: NAD(P)-binding domain-containing protein [Caldilineaceae bacterium]